MGGANSGKMTIGQPTPDVTSEGRYPAFNMDVEFVGHYLGQAMLTKGMTGLGVIQKPLKEKYFALRKSSDNRLGPEIGIRVNPSGLLLLFPGSQPGTENEEFYDISSIHFVEAVKFVAAKKNKKPHFAFLPIDMDIGHPAHEKLFSPLEKKFHHLTKISHPPMLACVMRRPTGVRAVDCHVLIIPVADDAEQMASLVRRFQEHPSDYGRYGPPSPRPPRDGYPKPDVIPPDQGPREDGKAANYAMYRGGGVELRNEHFRKNGDYNEERRSDGYNNQQNRSFERVANPDIRGHDRNSAGFEDRYRGNNNNRLSADDVFVERRPREVRSGGRPVERDSFGREFQFDNAVGRGERQWSDGDSGGNARNRSSENFPPKILVGPTSRHRSADSDEYKGFGRPAGFRADFDDPPYARPVKHIPSPVSPRGRSPPRAASPPPPRHLSREEENISSPSNMESRQEMDVNGKPIAKVPPHRHAGVRVLPSLPISGAMNKLKPVSPRSAVAPASAIHDDQAPTYRFDPPQEDSDSDNPYDNVPDKRFDGPKDYVKQQHFTENNDVAERGNNRNNATRANDNTNLYNYAYNGGAVGSHESRTYGDKSPDTSRAGVEGRQADGNRPWSYGEEKQKFLRQEREGRYNDGITRHGKPPADQGYGYEPSKQHGHKDAEIESMFSNMRTGYGHQGSVDFESSLGYLP